jgi:hypothetical protein
MKAKYFGRVARRGFGGVCGGRGWCKGWCKGRAGGRAAGGHELGLGLGLGLGVWRLPSAGVPESKKSRIRLIDVIDNAHLMLQAPRNGSPCYSIGYVELAGSGAEGAAIDRYGPQLQFGLHEADVQTALLHYSIFNYRNVKPTSFISPPRRLSLLLIGKVARRNELGTTEE